MKKITVYYEPIRDQTNDTDAFAEALMRINLADVTDNENQVSSDLPIDFDDSVKKRLQQVIADVQADTSPAAENDYYVTVKLKDTSVYHNTCARGAQTIARDNR